MKIPNAGRRNAEGETAVKIFIVSGPGIEPRTASLADRHLYHYATDVLSNKNFK